MILLLLGFFACSRPDVAAPTEAPCWAPVLVDELGESPAGLTVTYTHGEVGSCEVHEGDLAGYRRVRYDAAERAEHVVFEKSHDLRYERWDVWESDVCASSSVLDYHWPDSRGVRSTTTTCVDGWPSEAVTRSESTDGMHSWERSGHAAWTYAWEEGLPVWIEAASGESLDALVVTSTEERDYISRGRLTRVRTVTDTGSWGETIYTWQDDRLVAASYVSAYGSRTATWSYDAEGRVSGWWESAGPQAGTYEYVEGTRRIAAEYIDRAVDGVLDGVPDYFVGYGWSED